MTTAPGDTRPSSVPTSARRRFEGQRRPPVGSEGRLQRDAAVLLGGTALVGAGNYCFALVMVWILPPRQFSELASLNTLIMIMATTATAALPWVVTRQVVRTADGARQRSDNGAALAAAVMAALLCGALLFVLSVSYATAGAEVAAALTVGAVFIAQVGNGYLQGVHRFLLLSSLGVLEVAVKMGLGAWLATWGGAKGALFGGAIGAAVWAAASLWAMRGHLGRPAHLRAFPWGQLAGIGSIQMGMTAVVMMDIVVGSVVYGRSASLAGYQAMLVFTRVPLFLASAISAATYPRLVAEEGGEGRRRAVMGRTAAMYASVAAVAAAVSATIPRPVLALVLPSSVLSSIHLLVPLAVAGAAAGASNLLTTFFQGDSFFRTPRNLLWGAMPAVVLLEAVLARPLADLAWTAAGCEVAVAGALGVVAVRRYRGAQVGWRLLGGLGAGTLIFVVLRSAAGIPALWVSMVVLCLVGLSLNHRHATRRIQVSPSPTGVAGTEGGPPPPGGALLRPPTPVERLARIGVSRAMNRIRPLAPPVMWEALLSARSLFGESPVLSAPYAERVLVLAAHPDDETIGCGGTIALLAEAGSTVQVVLATRGEDGACEPGLSTKETGARRLLEGAAACQRLGAHGPLDLGLSDGGLAGVNGSLAAGIADAIERLQPDVVLGPWPLDGHSDHQAVAIALASALEKLGTSDATTVWSYEVWNVLPANRLVDITPVWERKVSALEAHACGRMSFDLDAHLALARWRSIFGMEGRGYGEAFLALPVSGYRDFVDWVLS